MTEMEPHTTNSRLVALLYLLLRDHVHPGDLENMVQRDEHKPEPYACHLSNGWLAQYAEDLAKRLLK